MERPIPTPTGGLRSAAALRVALVVFAAVFVALHVISPDGILGEGAYLVVVVVAAPLAVFGATRAVGEHRVPWRWVAIGVCLSALGDISYSVYVHTQGFEPDVSIADVPWLASYIALSIGLFKMLQSDRGKRRDFESLIDMAVVGVVALLVIWQLSVQTIIGDASVALDVRAVWASYPILDAVLLALVVHAAVRRSPGAFIVGAGVVCWLVSDFLYMLYPGSATWSRWLDAGWMIGALMLAAATFRLPSTRAPELVTQRVGAVRVALGIVPLLVPGVIELVGFSRGIDPNPVPMFGASLILASLVFARAVLILRAGKRAEDELRAAEQQFRALVQRSADAALVLDPDGRILYASAAVQDQFGYIPEDLVGRMGWDLVHPDDSERTAAALAIVADGAGVHASIELRLLDAAGEWRWVEQVVTNLLDEPAVHGFVANIRDISVRKAAEQKLSRLAHYDGLSGLPNRWRLTELLGDALANDRTLAVFIIDLDQFKFVNDSLGHAAGDQLLQAAVVRLESALGANDTIGRVGGDEFAIICRDAKGAISARRHANRFQNALADPIVIPGSRSVPVTASIGITIVSGGETPEQLLQQADTAMYAAKAQGLGQSVVFDDRLRQSAQERLTIQADLAVALRSDQLIVHYQPVVDLVTGQIEGVEALIRWRHPTRGLLSPAAFIPIAEGTDLIDAIGTFVLEQACTDAAWWMRAGHPLSVAVNVSAGQMRDDDITTHVQQALYNSGLDPRLLILEITETALLRGAERAITNIETIRSLGVRVALDDFGTGYSSLSFLKRIPADIVKIDQSFIADIEHNSVDRDIAAAIISLAGALGRTVIAEGIETEAQHEIVKRLACPLAQGYLWSPAVAVEAILPLVEKCAEGVPQLHIVPG